MENLKKMNVSSFGYSTDLKANLLCISSADQSFNVSVYTRFKGRNKNLTRKYRERRGREIGFYRYLNIPSAFVGVPCRCCLRCRSDAREFESKREDCAAVLKSRVLLCLNWTIRRKRRRFVEAPCRCGLRYCSGVESSKASLKIAKWFLTK